MAPQFNRVMKLFSLQCRRLRGSLRRNGADFSRGRRARKHMKKHIGLLTSGGDSPGLNAAIRAVGKAANGYFGMQVIGFRDGFRGIMENRVVPLDEAALSGILTLGGTILGTSRDRPERMPVGGKVIDATDAIIENYNKNHLDVLVCLGGGGTTKAALKLS